MGQVIERTVPRPLEDRSRHSTIELVGTPNPGDDAGPSSR